LNPVGGLTREHLKIYIPFVRDTGLTSGLHLGEILEGRVVKSLGNQKAIINLKGTEVLAETRSSLTTGSNIVVRVAHLKPTVVLSLLSQDISSLGKSASLIKTFLPNQVPFGQVVERLQRIIGEQWFARHLAFDKTLYQNLKSTLSTIVFDEEKMFKPEFLSNFLNRSGLLYETKLKRLISKGQLPRFLEHEINNDLKGLLLRISEAPDLNKGFFNKVTGEDDFSREKIGYFLKTVRELINNIELSQLANFIRKREDDCIYLQIPLAFQDEIDDAELYLYCNRRGRKTDAEKEELGLVFLLNMEGLGYLKIDVNIKKKLIYCQVSVEDPEVAGFISGFLPSLKDRLSALDYVVEKVDCVVLKDRGKVRVGLGENIIPESVRFVDVKV